jgi:serine/threonine-protein kinase
MGSVYLGFKEGDEEPVAIKILNDRLIAIPGFVDRFYREAQHGARLDHPHIVHTYQVAQDRRTGLHFIVMEYVDGPSAQALLDRLGQLSAADAVHIILGVARALEHAHARHIIHRDIKPDNILLTQTCVAKLADLGLAKNLDESSSLTLTHQGFGTTPYMPYEQALNARSADERSDIYALGATFYHLVTGTVPFGAGSDLDVIEKKDQGHYPPARALRPDLPESVDILLGRMLAREPDERFQSAEELVDALLAAKLAPLRPSFGEDDFSAPQIPAPPLASDAPTRVSVEAPAAQEIPAPQVGEQVWYLRYRDQEGHLYNRRATTEQIVRRLRKGGLPANAEARKPSQEGFFPLRHYHEFNLIPPASDYPFTDPPAEGRLPPG